MKALQNRPDLRAAQQGVTAAKSQYELQKAIGKVDITGQVNYTHVSGLNTAYVLWQHPASDFRPQPGRDRARRNYAITQAQEQQKAASEQVMTDVHDAYEGLRTNDKSGPTLYRSGYLDRGAERP